MTKALNLLLALLLYAVAAESSNSSSTRKETLAFWTPERLNAANSLLPLIGDDDRTVYVSFRVGNHLFRLKERDAPASSSTLDRRRLQGWKQGRLHAHGHNQNVRRLSPQEPSDGSVFQNPRTVTFKAAVERFESLSDLSFVFEHDGTSTPVTVAADEINDNDVAQEMVGGFADGLWTWHLQGKDSSGNEIISETSTFTIEDSTPATRMLQEDLVVAERDWDLGGEGGGQIQETAGRLYFQDSDGGWLCSGTAVKDFKTGRSLILTAAHCMYWSDWAYNVLFIPNRDASTEDRGQGRDCQADPCGCWTASGAVALDAWRTKAWPTRIPYDYGFYLVDDVGSHEGNRCNPDSEALDQSVDAMSFVVETPVVDEMMYGVGYPGNYDPDLRFCAETATTITRSFGTTWWMDKCGMLGGSSGGPWVKNMNLDNGKGQVVAVNSWGFSSRAGMGAAIIDPESARCLINHARNNMDFDDLNARPNGQKGDFIPLGPCPESSDDILLTATQVPSSSGDPHFKTWTGDKFDYHGECDLVLVDNPTFNNGQGLKLHIRTTRVKYFSYIERIALQIGDDVLEFANDVENFLINGEQVQPQHKYHGDTFAGFPLRRDPKAISVRLDPKRKAKIDFIRRKTGFPAVIVDTGGTDLFQGSLGLLGEWGTGKKLSRDGQTEINEEDATHFALEWQVQDTETMLFQDARFPQFPTKCIPPKKVLGGRLGKARAKKQAEKACAHWKEDKEDCIFDTMATRDIEIASEGSIVGGAADVQ